jgi:hypothetical protein
LHITQTWFHTKNADLMRCGIERIVVTHPIPLVIGFFFIKLGYLASITAETHWHWNTTR